MAGILDNLTNVRPRPGIEKGTELVPYRMPNYPIPCEDTLWNVAPIFSVLDPIEPPVFFPIRSDVSFPSPFASLYSFNGETSYQKSKSSMTQGTRELYETIRQRYKEVSDLVQRQVEGDPQPCVAYLRRNASGDTELEMTTIGRSRSFWIDCNQPKFRFDYLQSKIEPPLIPTHLRTELDFRKLEGKKFEYVDSQSKETRQSKYFVLNKSEHVMRINSIEIGRGGIAGPLNGFCVIELGDFATVLFWHWRGAMEYVGSGEDPTGIKMAISDTKNQLKPQATQEQKEAWVKSQAAIEAMIEKARPGLELSKAIKKDTSISASDGDGDSFIEQQE